MKGTALGVRDKAVNYTDSLFMKLTFKKVDQETSN